VMQGAYGISIHTRCIMQVVGAIRPQLQMS
jgi:hypothetical protein